MKRFKKIFSLMGLMLLILRFPAIAMAQVGTRDSWGELFPSMIQIGGVLPMDFNSLPNIIGNIIRIVLIVAALVVLIYLIIGGYQYTTAGGNAEQATAARTTILNAIIGVIIIFASYAIVTWVMTKFVS